MQTTQPSHVILNSNSIKSKRVEKTKFIETQSKIKFEPLPKWNDVISFFFFFFFFNFYLFIYLFNVFLVSFQNLCDFNVPCIFSSFKRENLLLGPS
jgi:hypothetical protein